MKKSSVCLDPKVPFVAYLVDFDLVELRQLNLAVASQVFFRHPLKFPVLLNLF